MLRTPVSCWTSSDRGCSMTLATGGHTLQTTRKKSPPRRVRLSPLYVAELG